MAQLYYLDTSIWLDFFENRDEPNLPKGKWAKDLLSNIVKNNDRIIYSDNNLYELSLLGYSPQEIKIMLKPFASILIFVESTKKKLAELKIFL